MMMKTLDKFLGRALIDPTFIASLENGEVDKLLKEYEFCDEIRSALQSIRASDFMDFAYQAISIVSQHDSNNPNNPFPWPSNGLFKQGEGRGRFQAA